MSSLSDDLKMAAEEQRPLPLQKQQQSSDNLDDSSESLESDGGTRVQPSTGDALHQHLRQTDLLVLNAPLSVTASLNTVDVQDVRSFLLQYEQQLRSFTAQGISAPRSLLIRCINPSTLDMLVILNKGVSFADDDDIKKFLVDFSQIKYQNEARELLSAVPAMKNVNRVDFAKLLTAWQSVARWAKSARGLLSDTPVGTNHEAFAKIFFNKLPPTLQRMVNESGSSFKRVDQIMAIVSDVLSDLSNAQQMFGPLLSVKTTSTDRAASHERDLKPSRTKSCIHHPNSRTHTTEECQLGRSLAITTNVSASKPRQPSHSNAVSSGGITSASSLEP